MRTPVEHRPRAEDAAGERITRFTGPLIVVVLVLGIIVFLARHWGW